MLMLMQLSDQPNIQLIRFQLNIELVFLTFSMAGLVFMLQCWCIPYFGCSIRMFEPCLAPAYIELVFSRLSPFPETSSLTLGGDFIPPTFYCGSEVKKNDQVNPDKSYFTDKISHGFWALCVIFQHQLRTTQGPSRHVLKLFENSFPGSGKH